MDFPADVIVTALFRLSDDGSISLPHGVCPHITAGTIVNEDAWERLLWNPPAGNPHLVADPSASPKPTWLTISTAAASETVESLRHRCLASLSTETERAIQTSYGVTSWRKEIEMRLAGRHTPQQDAERDRIRTRYKALKADIGAATIVSELEAIQSRIDDGTWKDDPADDVSDTE